MKGSSGNSKGPASNPGSDIDNGKSDQAEQEMSRPGRAKALPLFRAFIVSHSDQIVRRKQYNTLLIALTVLNILDGDFTDPSVLDLIKFALLALCFWLVNRKEPADD